MVESALRARWPSLNIETKIIKTSGDENAGNADAGYVAAIKIEWVNPAAGRKGLFTAEIERALLTEAIDIAVHSAKDLPSVMGVGTEIAAVLPRADANDVLVSLEPYNLDSIPPKGTVATGSVRRQHQLRWKRPDLNMVELRGNVPTRLRKLKREQWQGAILARAGLQRLGLVPNGSTVEFEGCQFSTSILPPDVFVPAGGQGIIAMQVRSEDDPCRILVQGISDSKTELCLRAEREFLRQLHGDCDQPVGVFAIVDGDVMKVRGQVFRPGVNPPRETMVEGNAGDAERLGAELLKRINDQ
jgi:hydroxymethylbilane synthase